MRFNPANEFAVKFKRDLGLAFFIFSILFSCCAFGIGTQAGTPIQIGRAEIFHDNRTDYSNELSLSVSQDYGLNLETPSPSGTVDPGTSFYSPHILTNVGNGSELYSLELSGTTDNWSSTLIKDNNLNGQREADENTPADTEVPLAEDAAYNFFVAITAPTHPPQVITGYTTLISAGKITDGASYFGANGSTYGGPDNMQSQVSAKLTRADTTPPTISNLIINNHRRFPEDIISSRPKIKCNITDDQPNNVGKIEVWFNDSLLYEGTSSDWKGAYNEVSGDFDLSGLNLPPATYTLKIKAFDKAGNEAQETLTPLYVRDDIAIVTAPLNYPNPFKPLKGETTSLAYVLTKDVDVTLYIYNIKASAVCRRNYKAFEEGGMAGYNEVVWDGRSDFNEIQGNGIYIFKIVHNQKVLGTGKITILD